MRRRALKVLFIFLAALMLCPAVFPASAAKSATAATMQLMKSTGAVGVTNGSGRSLSKRDKMLLYNGYHVETEAKSYAWINLDDAKLSKLDAVSEVEVRKSGKALELLLKSGNIYFNVSEPLEDDEALNVRTSTMIVGIRGTSGFIRVIDRWAAEIYVLEGTVQCSATDPVTGQIKTEDIHGGEKAIATAYPQDREGDKCDILRERFESGDIGGFVLMELAQDPALCADIYDETGIDVLPNLGLLESERRQSEDESGALQEQVDEAQRQAREDAQKRLEQDEQKIQGKLDEIEEQLTGQDTNVSTDPVWGTNGSKSSTPGAAASGGDMADDVTVPKSEFRMNMTDDEVMQYLAEHGPGTYTLLANSDTTKNTLTVDGAWTIPSGTTLNLDAGIDVDIAGGGSLTVDGTLAGTGALTNNGTLTVNSSNTLTMTSIVNRGTLNNTAGGRIVTNDIYIMADAANSGIIEGGVTVESGTFTMDGGRIDGGTGSAVILAVGTSLVMNGGEIASNDDQPTIRSDGRLTLTGGTITNDGTGCAVSAAAAGDVTIGSVVVRTKQKDLFSIDGLARMPDNYGRRYENSDGYFKMIEAVDYGDCGANLVWDFSGAALTISGTGDMDSYTASLNAPWYNHSAQITTVNITEGATSIGGYAFYGCTNLTGELTIPNSAASMEDSAFSGCTGLTDVIIGSSVSSIGNSAFSGCASLESVTLPVWVTSIGDSAFSGCDSLAEIYRYAVNPHGTYDSGAPYSETLLADCGITVGSGNDPLYVTTWYFEQSSL